MISLIIPTPSLRKKSKHDELQIIDQQDKINQMIRSFYDKLKSKFSKSFTKCQTRNAIICKELFDALSLHPKQELYETIKLHDLIFNEIDLLTEVVSDFLKRIDILQEKLKLQLILQKQRSLVKKQKQGENNIAILRKVSFKKENHTLKNRLISLDTINKKILKCEGQSQQKNEQNGFRFEIQGKKSQVLIYSYSKIWFQNKKREYLLCLGHEKAKNQFYIFNDKLQAISTFTNSFSQMGGGITFIQVNNFIYLVTTHKILRINLLVQDEVVFKSFNESIISAQSFNNELILWAVDKQKHHMLLFVDQCMNLYDQSYLKLNVHAVLAHFKLKDMQGDDVVYFLTRNYIGQVDILKIDGNEPTLVMNNIGSIEEVIPVWFERAIEEVILRVNSNKFLRFTGKSGLVSLDVDIDQGQNLKNCIILGEHFYALSENGKYMLQCHYQPSSRSLAV